MEIIEAIYRVMILIENGKILRKFTILKYFTLKN